MQYRQAQPSASPVCVLSHSGVSDSLWLPGLQPFRLLCPWTSPGKNTQGLPFPTPGDPPDPGVELLSLASPSSPALVSISSPLVLPGKPIITCNLFCRALDIFTVDHITEKKNRLGISLFYYQINNGNTDTVGIEPVPSEHSKFTLWNSSPVTKLTLRPSSLG